MQKNQLTNRKHFKQFISSRSFERLNNKSPWNLFKSASQPRITTRESLLKLSCHLQKSNHGHKSISLKMQSCGISSNFPKKQ